MINHTDTTQERRLWADVALLAIMDHAKRIHAAERGRKYVRVETSREAVRIGDTSGEIASARRYFRSPDWREVASLAGIDPNPERALKACLLGPKELRRITTKNLSEAYRDDE